MQTRVLSWSKIEKKRANVIKVWLLIAILFRHKYGRGYILELVYIKPSSANFNKNVKSIYEYFCI